MKPHVAQKNTASRQGRAQLIKGGVAGGITLICLIWLGAYFLWSAPTTVEFVAQSPAERFLLKARKIHDEDRFEYVTLDQADDHTVKIGGRVATAADLTVLHERMAQAQQAPEGAGMASEVTLEWTVKARR